MPRPDDPELARFAPRVSIMLVSGCLLFLISALAYVAPILLEAPPPGAVADWHQQRVQAHLEGKVLYILFASFIVAALLGARGWLPGTGPRRP
jgi:hypothetical protein